MVYFCMSQRIFETPQQLQLVNYKTGEVCELRSIDSSLQITDSQLNNIVKVCNEPLVFELLSKNLGISEYALENAKQFIEWAHEGWDKQEWFVFLIFNANNEVVGAIDIKSNNLDDAEVGFWLSQNASGIITMAISKLSELARFAGFKKLVALVDPKNEKSKAALTRANYKNTGDIKENDRDYTRFEYAMNELHITDGIPAHAESLVRTMEEVWVATYSNIQPNITKEDIQQRFAGKDRLDQTRIRLANQTLTKTYVAIKGKTVIGFCIVELGEKPWIANKLAALYILPKYQSQGIGKKLYTKSIEWIRHHNDRQIALEVVTNNLKSIEFYIKNGFKQQGKELLFEVVPGKHLTTTIMTLN